MNVATRLPAKPLRQKHAAAGLLTLLVLATVGSARSAETPAPAPLPSPAEQKLHQAVQQGDLPALKAAIADGADVNGRGTNGLPPLLDLLHAAPGPLGAGQRQCVACLLEHGANVDPIDSDRRTPLIHAARLDDLDTIRLLVEAGAYVMARDRLHKSALFYAVENHRRDIILYLASHGDLISLPITRSRPSR